MSSHPEGDVGQLYPRASRVKGEILLGAATRKRTTTERIWNLLLEMHREGVAVFSVGVVGRRCEKAGVYRTQSLRNEGGSEFRRLIEAFAEDVGASKTGGVTRVTSAVELALNEIRDLETRTRLKMVIVENRRLKVEVDRLKGILKQSRWQATSNEKTGGDSESLPVGQVDAVPIRQFLAEEFLAERGWRRGPNGTLLDDLGARISPVGFLDSLEAVISAFSRSS